VVVEEAFLDRGYAPDGTLLPRAHPDALLKDAAQVAARAVRIARAATLETSLGELQVSAQTLCVHSDTPGAAAFARAARDALEAVGVTVRAF
jgi:5-oxoprolinase (ATP-hydrolysing) subunit A